MLKDIMIKFTVCWLLHFYTPIMLQKNIYIELWLQISRSQKNQYTYHNNMNKIIFFFIKGKCWIWF